MTTRGRCVWDAVFALVNGRMRMQRIEPPLPQAGEGGPRKGSQ